MRQLHSNWWCPLICVTFLLFYSFNNLRYILGAAAPTSTVLQLKILCNLFVEGKCVSIKCNNISATFLFTFKLKCGLKEMIFCVFFQCYFAANLVVCIAVLLCNHIFAVLLHNLVFIVQIFWGFRNFQIFSGFSGGMELEH